MTPRAERLLVVVDRTDQDVVPAAVRHALSMASRNAGRLRLLHVVDVRTLGPDVIWVDPDRLTRALCAHEMRQLERIAERVRVSGVPVEAITRPAGHGIPAAIAEEARRWRSDLVVVDVARRRRPGRVFGGVALLAALLLGGAAAGAVTPQALIDAGAPPVLLVPDLLRDTELRTRLG